MFKVEQCGCKCDLKLMIAFQVILTVAEHHSCIVPWQIVSQKTGAVLKFVTLNEDETPDIDMLREMISRKTKLVAVHHVSNVLGKFFSHVCVYFFFFFRKYLNFVSF